MSKKAVPLISAALLAGLIGAAVFGGLTFTICNQLRRSALLDEAYQSAKKESHEALDHLILTGPVPATLQGIHEPLTDAAAKQAYAAAKKGSEADLDAFFSAQFMPPRWIPWLCLPGLVLAAMLLLRAYRGLFGDLTGRMVFIMGLCGTMGGYFWFMAGNGIYPMGIDLAGGTELIYRLEYADLDRRIALAQKRLAYLKEHQEQTDEQTKKPITAKTIETQQLLLQELEKSKDTAPDRATEVVRKRVDPTGTKGIPITKFGEDRIRIQLPKASPEDVERIKRAIRTQGRLSFHAVSEDAETIDKVRRSDKKEWGEYVNKEIWELDPYDPQGRKVKKDEVVIFRTPEMEGSGITSAYASRSEQGGYKISLHFDAAAAARFEEVSGRFLHKRLAIVLDGTCYLAPTIQSQISDQCQITGSFTKEQADEISGVLTSGSLPAEVVMDSEFVVGPTLGHEQIDSGIFATLIGAAAVAAFMWTYYRTAGFISIVNLAVLLSVMMGALGFFKATMTLPGIAGILLNLGMAVDANVLIYERLREELGRGRNLRQAVHMGFERAFVVIIDSQLTTLITGVILYTIGTGPVRGFAVTLSIGVLVTLFSNVWVCHQIFLWLVGKDALESLNMMQFFKATNFDFMGQRKKWMAFSATIIACSLAAFVYLGPVEKKIYDVDFTGGTLVQFNFAPKLEPTDEEVKAVVEKELRPKLKARLEETGKKLKELAASGKSGADLKAAVAAALPLVDKASFSMLSELDAKEVEKVEAAIQEVLKNYEEAEFTAQSFGVPVNAAEGRYKSFTLTTRFTERAVVETLDEELNGLFGAKMEPPSVEVAQNGVRLRIAADAADIAPAGIHKTIQDQISSMAARRENEDVRAALGALKVSDIQEETYGSGFKRPFVMLAPLPEAGPRRDRVVELLETAKFKHVDANEQETDLRAEGPISRKSSFGPQVALEMFLSSVGAVLAALVAIFAYVWFRFEFSPAWGFGALMATFHDPILCVGAACLVTATGLFPVLLNLDIIAAILTVIGYSVNDTIVVFDRIREVKTAHPTRDLAEIINDAVNATLSRTVLTSVSALIAMVSLLIFGGPTIRDLAFTLTVGIVVGTYSSIFIAAPMMMWWAKRYGTTRTAPAKAKEAKSDASAAGAQI
ncbi:MAG: protein translocase subunit SecD [Planctomycetota bacterium]|nr:protein translocase subunit SecD [Planctomycetota bacterium]